MNHTVHGVLQVRILEWVAFPSPEDLPNPGSEPGSPTLQADSLPAEPQGKCRPKEKPVVTPQVDPGRASSPSAPGAPPLPSPYQQALSSLFQVTGSPFVMPPALLRVWRALNSWEGETQMWLWAVWGARRGVSTASEEQDHLSNKMQSVLALPLISCVTLGKSLNLSGAFAPPSVKVRRSD